MEEHERARVLTPLSRETSTGSNPVCSAMVVLTS